MTCFQGTKNYLGVVLLISAAASLTHVGELLRRFGFEVHELCRIPTAAQMVDHDAHAVRLAIVDEALYVGAGVDPLSLLREMPSRAPLLIVQQSAARRDDSGAATSTRCHYLPPSFSPLDLTLTIVDALNAPPSCEN
ncbi:hypothetical protein [Nannocystis punicea]|uniref:Response regulatory domain-containing protein n=1 Tax=Nannocystis punicea TaxID=2995304 RepID=A0ABY7GUT2_9BACT|nr:hypothetical protein [Nannocystis poenicansa]WAS90712.1 hypothetical protein O0S08_31380 [Nannocystis poenicansa]